MRITIKFDDSSETVYSDIKSIEMLSYHTIRIESSLRGYLIVENVFQVKCEIYGCNN